MTISDTTQQDTFLNDVRRAGKTMELSLCDGQKIQGIIKGFDRYGILVHIPGRGNMLVFKHAVASLIAVDAQSTIKAQQKPARKTLRDVKISDKDMFKPIIPGPDIVELPKSTTLQKTIVPAENIKKSRPTQVDDATKAVAPKKKAPVAKKTTATKNSAKKETATKISKKDTK